MAEPSVIGIGQLGAKFKALAKGMEQRASRAMVVAGGQVLKAESKRLALSYGFKKTGALLKNIVIKRERTPVGTAQYNLGVRHGKNLTKKQKAAPGKRLVVSQGRIATRYADDPFYWRFLELGWIPRKTAIKGGERKRAAQREKDAGKKIKGRSFIGDALGNKQTEAIDAMSRRLQAELDKAAR